MENKNIKLFDSEKANRRELAFAITLEAGLPISVDFQSGIVALA